MIVRGVFQSRGFLLIFYRERQILKTTKVLVKPLFSKSERITDWSDLMISCFTSYISFTLNVYVGKSTTYVTAHCYYISLNIFFLQVLALFAIRSILSGLKKYVC